MLTWDEKNWPPVRSFQSPRPSLILRKTSDKPNPRMSYKTPAPSC